MTTATDLAPASIASITCPRDRVATRLTCARCGAPICPSCLARTAVGLQCPGCAGVPRGTGRRRLRPLVAAVVAAVALLTGVATQLSGNADDAPEAEVAVESTVTGLDQMVTVGSFAVTVTGYDCTDETGMRRCVANLLVRNDALGPRVFPTSLQRAVGGIRRFVPSSVAAGDQASAMVNPGTVAEVDVVFLMPETLDATRLELRSSTRQTPVRVTLPA